MNPVIEELRAALRADMGNNVANELSTLSSDMPGYSRTHLAKAGREIGLTPYSWSLRADGIDHGEVVIATPHAKVVIPVAADPILEVAPQRSHRFDTQTEQAMCSTAQDALEIVFEDDADLILSVLQRIGLTFKPPVHGDYLRFDKTPLTTA